MANDSERGPILHYATGGELSLEGEELVDRFGWTNLLGRKRQAEQRLPVSSVSSVTVRHFSGGASLSIAVSGEKWARGWGTLKNFLECADVEGVRAFARALTAQGPHIEFGDCWAEDQHNAMTPSAPSTPSVQVKHYKDHKAYERDARQMAPMGWFPQGQSSQRGKVKLGTTTAKAAVFLPWAVMRPARKGDPLTVTWVKEQAPPAPPHPSSAPTGAEDVPGKLHQLADLRDQGVITEADFEAKKSDLLSRL